MYTCLPKYENSSKCRFVKSTMYLYSDRYKNIIFKKLIFSLIPVYQIIHKQQNVSEMSILINNLTIWI